MEPVPEDSDVDDTETVTPRHPKKFLTRKRLVNSIENALNIENYELYSLLEKTISITVKIKNGKDSTELKFINQSPEKRASRKGVGRQAARNVIRGKPGVTAVGKESELDHLKLFLTDKFIRDLSDNFNSDFKFPLIKTVEMDEFLAFLELFYYRALWHQNRKIIFQGWSKHLFCDDISCKIRVYFTIFDL